MPKRFFLTFCLLGLGLSLLSPISRGIAQSDAPYIYYYSSEKQSFIIERADGTDSYVLASHSTSENGIVQAAGWSSSGKWFAWSSAFSYLMPDKPIGAIVSRDGKTLISLVDITIGAPFTFMEWSPQADLLFVQQNYFPLGSQNIPYVEPPILRKVFIYDPAKQEVVVEFAPELCCGDWVGEGQYILLETDIKDVSITRFNLFNVDGIEQEFLNPTFSHEDCSSDISQIFFVEDYLIYTFCQQVVVEDMVTGNALSFESPHPTTIFDIDWNTNQQEGIIYFGDNPSRLSAYYLSPSLGIFQQLSKIITREDWIFGAPYLSHSTWSPDGKLLFLISSDYTLYLLDRASLLLEEIKFPLDKFSINYVIWHPLGESIFFSVEQPELPHYGIYRYELQSSQFTLVESSDAPYTPYYNIAFSEGGRYTSVTHSDDITIRDQSGNIVLEASIIQSYDWFYHEWDGQSAPPFSNVETVWHPDQNWFFIQTSWDYDPIRHVNISDVSGKFQRELSTIYITINAFGWLPEERN